MSEKLDIKTTTIRSNTYQRFYATDTHLTKNSKMFNIDFVEEYMDAQKMYDREKEDDSVYLTREIKGSVSLPKDEAERIATRILEWLEDEAEDIVEIEEEEKEEVEMK